jgi:hypothetical protein
MKESLPPHVINELDKVVCYLLTSSRSYIDEPQNYVPMRLLEGASIILNILCIYDNKYLWLNEEVEKIKTLPLDSEEKYLKEINRVLIKLIENY